MMKALEPKSKILLKLSNILSSYERHVETHPCRDVSCETIVVSHLNSIIVTKHCHRIDFEIQLEVFIHVIMIKNALNISFLVNLRHKRHVFFLFNGYNRT